MLIFRFLENILRDDQQLKLKYSKHSYVDLVQVYDDSQLSDIIHKLLNLQSPAVKYELNKNI